MNIQEAAQSAILVQDACNLSAVVRQFERVCDCLWTEAKKQGKGTEWVNSHPISVLFADKIAHLTHTQGDGTSIHQAMDKVEKMAKCLPSVNLLSF